MSTESWTREVLSETEDVPDRTIRVSRITSGLFGEFGEVREYVPSTEKYGRGITFPTRYVRSIVSGLEYLLEADADTFEQAGG